MEEMMEELTDAQRALAGTEVLRLVMTGVIGLLIGKGVVARREIAIIIDGCLERAEGMHADPDGPGALAVNYMRAQLETLLDFYTP